MQTTLGPRIVRDDTALARILPAGPRTGIRRTNSGGWAAVKDGRLVADYSGIGAKRSAIEAAGTNREIG